MSQGTRGSLPRRDFLKTSAAVTAATMASGMLTSGVFAQGDDTIRLGLIGCGGRGSGAAANACSAADGVELYAMGDLFGDKLEKARTNLKEPLGDKYNVVDDRAFSGFDAFQKVLASGINYALLTTPPGFRPMHFEAAVEAGVNCFIEKPVAVCPAGAKRIIAVGEAAKEKGLGVVAGTQYRHHKGYQELMKRMHDGEIGDLVAAQGYYNTGGLWKVDRTAEMTDIEWQIRNWLYFTWLAGDHVAEQHIHHLDTINWALGGPPEKVVSLGGRQVRTDPAYGQIYDHFVNDFTYPGGVKVMSMCRQIGGCANRLGEHFIGTNGTGDGPVMSPAGTIHVKGQEPERITDRGGLGAAYVQEHRANIEAIRKGEPLNEAKQVAETTMTAILARMSAYTGKEVTWEWAMNESTLNLMRDPMDFGDMEVDPVAMPGQTELI